MVPHVEVTKIVITQNGLFQWVGRTLIRKKIPRMAINVFEFAIDARCRFPLAAAVYPYALH